LQQEWAISALDMQAALNAGAVGSIEATVQAGAAPKDAYKWWMGELARRANEQGVDVAALPVTPQQVARLSELVADGTLTDKLARQVLDGVLDGEGSPDDVVAARGLQVVSDDAALGAAVDAAIAADPDVAGKVRDGKVAAAGALVGAVMRATRGQADAARVRELILQKLAP
jgi:aspartyl-tRNA(Asn)/glutamyl-tRNA(Gln) amidotransferase subunit B